MITIDQTNIDLKIDGFYEADKSIATLDTVKIGNLFAILQVAIKLGVDSISGTTFNLNSILAIYDLDFINLNESKLEPFDHYYRFAITPKYDLQKLFLRLKEFFRDFIEILKWLALYIPNDWFTDDENLA